MEIYDVVMKMIGEVEPVGETHADDASFENLKQLTGLTDKLLSKIDEVAFYNADRHEYSRKRSGEHSRQFITQWRGNQ